MLGGVWTVCRLEDRARLYPPTTIKSNTAVQLSPGRADLPFGLSWDVEPFGSFDLFGTAVVSLGPAAGVHWRTSTVNAALNYQ